MFDIRAGLLGGGSRGRFGRLTMVGMRNGRYGYSCAPDDARKLIYHALIWIVPRHARWLPNNSTDPIVGHYETNNPLFGNGF
jgi:hypothetical protein